MFLDVNMPGMSGYDVAREVLERHRSKPPVIVGLTGDTSQETRELGRLAGMEMVLSKPVSRERLGKCLSECLGAVK